jgi:hypothetical protein
MKFGRTGLAVIGLFAVAAIGCPQPSHKKNDGGGEETGGEGGEGGSTSTGGKTTGTTGTGGTADTGGSSGSTGGSSGSTGGSSGSTGGSSGSTGGSSGSTGGSSGGVDGGAKADGGGGMGGAGGGGGADMAAFTDLYNNLIKPKCGPGCHITGSNGNLMMPNAMAAYTNLVNKMASNTTCKMLRVKPGDSTMSVLSKKVSGATCGTRMPAGGKPALTAAEIKMIDDWINGQ